MPHQVMPADYHFRAVGQAIRSAPCCCSHTQASTTGRFCGDPASWRQSPSGSRAPVQEHCAGTQAQVVPFMWKLVLAGARCNGESAHRCHFGAVCSLGRRRMAKGPWYERSSARPGRRRLPIGRARVNKEQDFAMGFAHYSDEKPWRPESTAGETCWEDGGLQPWAAAAAARRAGHDLAVQVATRTMVRRS